jgi:hypothetical protein
VLAVAVGAATGLSGLAVAHADPATGLSGTPTDLARTVTLVTGDRIVLGPNGSLSLLPAAGSSGSLASYRAPDGDRYLIPTTAAPYLSRQLDPSLFDVTALAAAENGAAGGRVPLQLTFTAGSTPTAPAGITLTSVTGDSATGYLTPASGPAFSTSLRTAAATDRERGRPVGSTPLVPGLTDISLAGAPSAPVATPHYPLHILQLSVNDLTGKPADFASVFLVDTDQTSREQTFVPIGAGIGRIAVPAGNYTALGLFDDLDASGNLVALRTVVQYITVPATGAATATINEVTATTPVTVTTPKPANADYELTTFLTIDSSGVTGAGFQSIDFGTPPPTYINPAPAPPVGTLHYVVQWGGEAPTASDNYRYDLAFASDNGIPADQSYSATDSQLATVHDQFSADPAAGPQGSLLNGASDPVLARFGASAIGMGTPMPGTNTDYLGTNDSGSWSQQVFTANGLAFLGDARTFAAGRTYTVAWAHGPLAAGLGQYTGSQFCLVCSAGSDLQLGVDAIGDNVPGHAGVLFTEPTSSHFTLYRDGAVVFDQDGYDGAELTGIPAAPSTYRAVFDLSMAGVAGFSQSTVTHTDLTMRYNPTASPGSALPADSSCFGETATTPCEILPALTLNYQLASDQTNTSTAPVQVLKLGVDHVSYDGAGSRAPITGASVRISFDSGTTWQRVPVIGFDGSYVALWRNPSSASGTDPSIEVTATDAIGGSISQTISNAYTVGTISTAGH